MRLRAPHLQRLILGRALDLVEARAARDGVAQQAQHALRLRLGENADTRPLSRNVQAERVCLDRQRASAVERCAGQASAAAKARRLAAGHRLARRVEEGGDAAVEELAAAPRLRRVALLEAQLLLCLPGQHMRAHVLIGLGRVQRHAHERQELARPLQR